AIAFAEDVFGRTAAAVLGEIERDDLCNGLGVRVHAIKRLAAVGLCPAAPARAHPIAHDQIGKRHPGSRVVPQAGGGSGASAAPPSPDSNTPTPRPVRR